MAISKIKDTAGNVHDIGVNWDNIIGKPDAFIDFGTCETAAATSAKVVNMTDIDWSLEVGNIIGVKFTNSNSASSVTLNVNNSGAKNIYYNNTKYTGNSTSICGYANRVSFYMYDGTYWVWLNMGSLDGNTNTVPSAQCETAAASAAKTATCTNYSLLSKSFLHVNIRYSNTSKTALTFNVNSKGARPIYINGSASSTSNYTLPAGTYIVYYDGTNYHFRTDGILPGKILDANHADSATNATTATNLANKPTLSIGPETGDTICVTVGGKSSNFFTVPYATDATNADKLKIGLVAGSEEKRLSICATSLTQSGGYGDVYQIPNIALNGGDFTIGYETYINSKLDVGAELHVTGGDILCGNIKCNESITAAGGFNGNLNGTATNATNDGGGNNISATYALKADFEGFTEYVESDFVKKTGSLKNPNAIKFKNKSGTVITYDGSSAADLSGGVYYAATAGSAKNPNAIKFKNALGTVITYDGSSAADLSGGVYNATTATNANKVKVNTSTANSNLPILFTTTYPSTGTKETASNRAVYVDSEKNKFYYNPNSNQVTAAGGFFETSDERLKDIVNPITVDLDKLSKLRKVYFNWKDKPDSDLQLGMIAQDVQELYPELVSESEEGQLSLSYEKLSVIALEAIDILHNENNELKSRIERLESLVNQLAEKVND